MPSLVSQRKCEWWGIDMTKVIVEGFGWMYTVVILDWYTKKIVGYYAGMQCRSKHWLEALANAVNHQFPDGVYGASLSLMSDNGSQPTSLAFMKACRQLGIKPENPEDIQRTRVSFQPYVSALKVLSV